MRKVPEVSREVGDRGRECREVETKGGSHVEECRPEGPDGVERRGGNGREGEAKVSGVRGPNLRSRVPDTGFRSRIQSSGFRV